MQSKILSRAFEFPGMRTLTGRLALFFLAALAVTALFFFFVERSVHSRLIQRESGKQLRIIAHQTLASMLFAMRREPPKSIEEVLSLAAEEEGVKSIHVLDASGTIRHSSDPALIGKESARFRPEQLAWRRELVVTERTASGSKATILEPIVTEERCRSCHGGAGVKGMFEMELDTTEMTAGFDAARWWLRASVGVSLLFTLGLLWFLLRRFLIGPVNRLLASMRRVGSGDLGERVELSSPREFRELGVQFNAMVEKLEAAKAKLDRYYQDSLTRAGRLATMGELATTMAHEIQNPLAGISGALQVLRGDPLLSDRREIVDEILLNLDRLSKTARDLLNFARPPAPRPEKCDVNQSVRSVLKLLRPDPSEPPGIEVVEDLEPGLPPVWSDPQQIRQVLLNVCLNALQAIPASGRMAVKTWAEGKPEPTRVHISVSDDGVGIPPENLEKIFEPFFTTKSRGTGLGLSISRSIVERHGGRMNLTSREGQGTLVEIEIPVGPARLGPGYRAEGLPVSGDEGAAPTRA